MAAPGAQPAGLLLTAIGNTAANRGSPSACAAAGVLDQCRGCWSLALGLALTSGLSVVHAAGGAPGIEVVVLTVATWVTVLRFMTFRTWCSAPPSLTGTTGSSAEGLIDRLAFGYSARTSTGIAPVPSSSRRRVTEARRHHPSQLQQVPREPDDVPAAGDEAAAEPHRQL